MLGISVSSPPSLFFSVPRLFLSLSLWAYPDAVVVFSLTVYFEMVLYVVYAV